jgi:hypothetical protein
VLACRGIARCALARGSISGSGRSVPGGGGASTGAVAGRGIAHGCFSSRNIPRGSGVCARRVADGIAAAGCVADGHLAHGRLADGLLAWHHPAGCCGGGAARHNAARGVTSRCIPSDGLSGAVAHAIPVAHAQPLAQSGDAGTRAVARGCGVSGCCAVAHGVIACAHSRGIACGGIAHGIGLAIGAIACRGALAGGGIAGGGIAGGGIAGGHVTCCGVAGAAAVAAGIARRRCLSRTAAGCADACGALAARDVARFRLASASGISRAHGGAIAGSALSYGGVSLAAHGALSGQLHGPECRGIACSSAVRTLAITGAGGAADIARGGIARGGIA